MMTREEFKAKLEAKYVELRAVFFDRLSTDLVQTHDSSELIITVLVLVQLAGEAEALINSASTPTRSRIEPDTIYGVYTDGYNQGFKHALEYQAQAKKIVQEAMPK